jgi:creatinine amidohydrolase
MMLPKRFWREMRSADFGPRAADWIAVLPLAATEQHGPHLPLAVDSLIAEGLVARCAAALPDDAPVTFLPVQEVGKSNEHGEFPGTLTLSWDTAIRTWIEIGESVGRAGPGTLLMVTSHGGNSAAMDVAARELRICTPMRIVSTSWGRLGRWQEIYAYQGPIIDIHAGLSETALMLALRPDLVDMTRARNFPSAQTELALASSLLGYHGAAANIAWLAEDLNPDGAVGDATLATATDGLRDIEGMVEGFCALIADLRRHRPESS